MLVNNITKITFLLITLGICLWWIIPTAKAQTFSCSTVTEISAPECQALVALFNSTNGSAWRNNSGWLTTNAPCSWYGVTECASGHVTGLDLQFNNLNGTLPAELGSLTSLQNLSLSSNNLVGALPTQIGNLRNLHGLGLSFTALSGELPSSLTGLAQLQEFYFNNTNLCQPNGLINWLNNIAGSRSDIICEAPQPTPPPSINDEPIQGLFGVKNLLFNGNFEFGFYGVPNMGFEIADWSRVIDTSSKSTTSTSGKTYPNGNLENSKDRPDFPFFGSAVPNNWHWFKNDQAHGKYRIYNNEEFGLICPDDIDQNSIEGKNSLSFGMQSTDEPYARLGVYQTVEVVAGQTYLFAISGTVEYEKAQDGKWIDPHHRVMLAFDQKGGQDWQAIPQADWLMPYWSEYDFEYMRSSANDPDAAKIQDFFTTIKAKSNKLTVFISAIRELPAPREGRFTFDCVSLIPLNKVNDRDLPYVLSNFSTTDVDAVLGAAKANAPTKAITAAQVMPSAPNSNPAASPPMLPITGDTVKPTPPAANPATLNGTTASRMSVLPMEIPFSGGVPEQKNRLLMIILAVVVIVGLVGVGAWSIRRKKQNSDE